MKIFALIPAYNAAKTIAEIVARIPRTNIDGIVVVDDGSADGTSDILKTLDVHAVVHPRNMGYGAAQVSLYRKALELNADATVILHADGGHVPEEIPAVIDPILKEEADVVVGSRINGIMAQVEPLLGSRMLSALVRGPMPGYKFFFHLLLTAFQNIGYGTDFHCFHSGFRACTRGALLRFAFDQLTTWYDYDTEFLLAANQAGLRITEVPVSAYYDPRAWSSAPSIHYGLRVVQHTLTYRWKADRKRKFAPVSQDLR